MWNRILRRLHLARELSFTDWLALVESWWVLAYYHFALRWVSLERLMQPDLKTSGKPSLRAVSAKQSPVSKGLLRRGNHPPRSDVGIGELLDSGNILEQLSAARRLHRLVGRAARLHLLLMTCLVQSLALRWMLSRRGIASHLKIGAAKDLCGFRAHAWLEVDGEKVGESEDVDGIFRILRGTSPPSTS